MAPPSGRTTRGPKRVKAGLKSAWSSWSLWDIAARLKSTFTWAVNVALEPSPTVTAWVALVLIVFEAFLNVIMINKVQKFVWFVTPFPYSVH